MRRPGARWSGAAARPSAFQARHIPSWRGSCERYAQSSVAAAGRWLLLLLLLSPLLSVGAHDFDGTWRARRNEHAPPPRGDRACAADRDLRPALGYLGRAIGAFDRLSIDLGVLHCVTRSPTVTADRRIVLPVPHEVPDRDSFDIPHPADRADSPAADVNHAAFINDRMRHTSPALVVGPRSLTECEPSGSLHPV